tara:strand:- start:1579 stop:1824 length:246 start_codon:yes stop_codon:yes gene_type:complete
MTEETKNETLEILKLLVEKITKLEQTVFNDENLLMKSGLVVTETPRPRMETASNQLPNADSIAKMSWDDINSMMGTLEGSA